jgi:hypothetical protein
MIPGGATTLAVMVGAAALAAASGVAAQVDVLTPDMAARLEASTEKPLALAPDGELQRFLATAAEWEEAASPVILDLDQDGVQDYLVTVQEGEAGRRAMVIYEWGDAPDVLGKAVFYLILDGEGEVVEWAGKFRLSPRPARDRAAPPPRSPSP